MELLALGVGLLTILVGAELFTNGVEWLGRRLGLSQGAVGGVLAAVGTALPETVIPLVAILLAGSSAGSAGDEIGVGAILGSPFMIATLAMFVTGTGVLVWRSRRASGTRLTIDTASVAKDVRFFFLAYAIAVGAALLPAELGAWRYVAAAAVLVVYGLYVRRHLTAVPDIDSAELKGLRLAAVDIRHHRSRPDAPRLATVLFQVALALALIVGGAIIFVDGVEQLSLGLGINAALLALVIAPVATELPEMFNSLIWVRQGKDTLAMGNLTGALVFQSAIPTTIGMTLATQSWAVTGDTVLAFASAAIAFASAALIFLPTARRGYLSARHLLVGGLFYVVYVGLVMGRVLGLW
jgi:cation:H+ antiporter